MKNTWLQPWRARYAEEKKNLMALLPVGQHDDLAAGVQAYMQAGCALADTTLQAIWAHFPLLQEQACLCATGGYGRQELYPNSDIDVLLLVPESSSAALEEQSAAFLSACWDVGLEMAASVRTLAQCREAAREDLTLQTALLESRYLAGQAPLCQQMQANFWQDLDPKAFAVAKVIEMRQRHEQYKNTPYELEPNCKESPGGLRDLHVLLWLGRATGLAKNWTDFLTTGLATALEAEQLEKNWTLLAFLRCHLHLLSGRHEDRLLFDWQNPLAQHLGYGQIVDTIDGVAHERRPSEALMRDYYWAAKAVTQLNQIVLQNIQERLQDPSERAQPVAINARFFDLGGLIEVGSEDLYLQQPQAILETFYLYQTQHGVHGLSARTLRALYNARHVMDDAFRADPANRAMFIRILQAPEGITHVMRLMNQTSVLGRYLLVFRHIVGQMQHDLMHIYTVDQHILMVLRNVRRFFLPEHASEEPFCSELAAGWSKPWLLWVGALFHDVAKGRGGDHSRLGAAEVERFCHDHGLSDEDQSLIVFLVREHLTMSQVAQKKDLSDPEVIADFAALVQTERRLTGLYLLTVADIRGTNPQVWTAWKGKLLQELYKRTLAALGGARLDPEAEIETRKLKVRQELARYALPFEAQAKLWKTLDASYFVRHEAGLIAWHTRVLSKVLAQHPYFQQEIPAQEGRAQVAPLSAPFCVFARVSPAGAGLQVLVYALDQPDLFARLCAFFDQTQLSVNDAKIYTAPNAWVMDTFELATPDAQVQARELCSMIEAELPRYLAEQGALPAPKKGRVSRRVRHFPIPPHISLQGDGQGRHWVLELSCADRLGLLYLLARVLTDYRLSVQSAKIVTLGERVEDRLVLSGPGLHDETLRSRLELALLQALEPEHKTPELIAF